MSLHLYNTLTRSVEPFHPAVPPRVTLYSCGPTVWNVAHIGNFRTFLLVDLLRRWLESSGYEVFHIMNLTDVDDRIMAEAGKRNITIGEFTGPFVHAFVEDRDWLRIRPAHSEPRATAFIPAMIRLVSGLLERGVAYRAEDGSVYFSIARFPAYGRLARLDPESLRAGGSERVLADDDAKESARDFVLWKAARPEDEAVGAAWDAPFGRGRPGWHLECSAMALDIVGERFGVKELDIHAGGVDLIFPHHEDEIAQACAWTGQEVFARCWVHGEFLNVRGEKMSKRFGNTTTVRDLREDGWDPAEIRYLMTQAHYRQKLDLTDEALTAARAATRRLGDFTARLREAPEGTDPGLRSAAETLRETTRAAMDDDLDAPRAMGAAFEFLRETNRLLDAGAPADPEARDVWAETMALFDVLAGGTEAGETRLSLTAQTTGPVSDAPHSESVPDDPSTLMSWAEHWGRRRLKAKGERDYAEADRIRDLLRAAGFEIRDRKDGQVELVRRS